MNHVDLMTSTTTPDELKNLRNGQIRNFRSTTSHDRHVAYGFFCTTPAGYQTTLHGVDPDRVNSTIMRATAPLTVGIIWGFQSFDHSNGDPNGPLWKLNPIGTEPGEGQSYQAALVYGDATVGPFPFALRMYSGEPGQTADSFRAELLDLLSK